MDDAANYLKGTAGALVGAVLGVVVFTFLYRRGLYAGLLVGALTGFGAQAAFKGSSLLMGGITAVVGLVMALFAEWYAVYDEKPLDFLTQLHLLPQMTILLIAIGTIAAFMIGRGK